MRSYENIVVVQSYPNLVDACNFVLKRKDERSLFLINGDLSIEKFARNLFKEKNIEVIRYGNALFLRHKPFSFLRIFYVAFLLIRIPKFECTNLLVTFGNWCDVGAIFLTKVKHQHAINLIAYEEKKYRITPGASKLPHYIMLMNQFMVTKVESKVYFYRDPSMHERALRGYGLEASISFSEELHASREKDYTLIPPVAVGDGVDFVLYIEKNITKSKSGSVWSLVRLSIAIRRFAAANDIKIMVKFKPRDTRLMRSWFYRALGFRIVDAATPAQLYAISRHCLCVIGFASSSMAENYGKDLYCLSSINRLFSASVVGNVESLRQRSQGNGRLHFFEDLNQLETLKLNRD